MENKIKYRIEADFEGWMWTGQKDVEAFKKGHENPDDFLVNVYRGHVRNVKMMKQDSSLPDTDFRLMNVHNIQVEPGGEWPFSNPRIFDFYQFHLDGVTFGQPNFQEGIFSPQNRDKTYCSLKGRLYGTILERRVNPSTPEPIIPPENCVPCSQQVKSGGFGVDEQLIRLGTTSGLTYIRFNPLDEIDKLEIFYRGNRIWSTHQLKHHKDGFVGGNLDKESGISSASKNKLGTFFYQYHGDEFVKVVVTGKVDGTKWDYTLFCPGVVPPDAELEKDDLFSDTLNPKKWLNSGCLKWLWYLLLLLLLLLLLQQCSSLGQRAICWYDKLKNERLLKETNEELEEVKKQQKQTEQDVKPCEGKKWNGTKQVDVQYIELGDKPGKVTVDYNMYELEDMIELYYDGEMVGSSNRFVVWKNQLRWDYKAEKGRPTRFMIKMIPGPDDRTKWKYDVYCP